MTRGARDAATLCVLAGWQQQQKEGLDVRYEEGEPVIFGYSIEPYWGESWVDAVMEKTGKSWEEVTRLLERGGENGGHLSMEEVRKILGSQ